MESITGLHKRLKTRPLDCRYDNHIPTRFLAPIDCSKIPAQGYLLPLELASTVKLIVLYIRNTYVYIYIRCLSNKTIFIKTVKSPACSDTWIDLPDLNEEREGLALMNIQGTVMAVGGSIRGELLDIVETWDGEK